MTSGGRSYDVVYPLVPGPFRNRELRYSLRSLQYFPVRDVHIVGHLPTWCVNVVHHEFEQRSHSPVENVVRKLAMIAGSSGVSEEFLWMNDDFYLLEPWSFKRYRRLGTKVFRGEYKRAVAGMEDEDYELHCPLMMEKSNALKLCSERWGVFAFRSAYCRMFPEPSEPIVDQKIKVNKNHRWVEPSGAFFSTDDYAIEDKEAARWMQARFPEKSRWET